MTINTKFSIDEDIYFMSRDEIRRGKIVSINMVVSKSLKEQQFALKESYTILLYARESTVILNSSEHIIWPQQMYRDVQSLLQLLADNI